MKKKISLADIPLNQRFIETVSPGIFFGDTCEVKWPRKSWLDENMIAMELKKDKNNNSVGFMRFIYDPSEGKVYLDDGWRYFNGVKLTKEECLSGLAKSKFPKIPLTDIALSNIDCNNWDIVWFEKCEKIWPLQENDKVL